MRVNMGIKTLLSFLKRVTDESNLDHFKDVTAAVDVSCWLHKAISLSLSRFGDDEGVILQDFSCVNLWILRGFLYLFVKLKLIVKLQ